MRLCFEAGVSFSGIPYIPFGTGFEIAGGMGFVGGNASFNGEVQPLLEGHGEVTYSFLIPISLNNPFYKAIVRGILEDTIEKAGRLLSPDDKALITTWLDEFCS